MVQVLSRELHYNVGILSKKRYHRDDTNALDRLADGIGSVYIDSRDLYNVGVAIRGDTNG